MKIPNVDGVYQTRTGSIVIIVTRKGIEVELKKLEAPVINYIEDGQNYYENPYAPTRSPPKPDGMKKVKKTIQNINDILMGDDS